MSYEFGLALAVLIFVADFVFSVGRFFSWETTNYAKVGMLYSLSSGSFNPYNSPEEKPTKTKRFILSAIWIAFRFAFCFLGWIYVFFAFLSFVHTIRQFIIMPNEIKMAVWKLRWTNLPNIEVINNILILNGNWTETNVENFKAIVEERLGIRKAS